MTDNAPPAEADELLFLSYAEAMEQIGEFNLVGARAYAMALRIALSAEREKAAGMEEHIQWLRDRIDRLEDQMRRARQELHNTLMTLEEWPT